MNAQILDTLRSAHGIFNITVMALFLYQAFLGLQIRRSRSSGSPSPGAIRAHRRNGPLWMILATLGYSAGLFLVTVDQGKILSFPPHFVTGTLIILLLMTTFVVSRQINGDVKWRNRHLGIGIAIITLYIVQILLGIRLLMSFRR